MLHKFPAQLIMVFVITGLLMGCGGVASLNPVDDSSPSSTLITSSPSPEPTALPLPTTTPIPQPSSTPEPTAITFPLLESIRLEDGISVDSLVDLEPVWLGDPGSMFLLRDDEGEARYQVIRDSSSGEWAATSITPVHIDADGHILLWDNESLAYVSSDAPAVAESVRGAIADVSIAELRDYGDEGYALLDEEGAISLIYVSDSMGWEMPGTDGEIAERNGRFFVWQDGEWIPAGLDSEQIAAQLSEDDTAWPLGRDAVYTTNNLVGIWSDIVIEDLEIFPGELVRIHGLLSYLDAEGQIRQVRIPILIEHLDTMTNHVFLKALSGVSEYSSLEKHWPVEELRRHAVEEMQYPFKYPVKTYVAFGVKRDLRQLYWGQEFLFSLTDGMHPNGFDEFRVAGDPESLGNEDAWLIPYSLYWVDPEFPDFASIVIPEQLQPVNIYNYYPEWHDLPDASEFVLLEPEYQLRYLVRFNAEDSTWHLEEARPVEIDADGNIIYWEGRNFHADLPPIPPELMTIVENEQLAEVSMVLRLHEDGYNVVDGYQIFNSEGRVVLELGSDGDNFDGWVWTVPDDGESSP